MNSWHRKNMGDGIAARHEEERLFKAFQNFVSNGVFPNISVFFRRDLETNVVTWWFSPEASELAQNFEAQSCEKPLPEGAFGLLVGDNNALKNYFPEYIADLDRRAT